MWIVAAILSALFAGITTILFKCGIKKVNSNLATAIKTSVVLAFAWIIVFATGAHATISQVSVKSWIFLILSGLASGISTICYFKGLSVGEVSKVAAVDKSSSVLTVMFAIIIFPDERGNWYIKLICLAIIAVGTFLMVKINKNDTKQSLSWLFFAFLAAIFAAATSLFAKAGIENVDSNLATAIRTAIVLVMSWGIVVCRKELKFIKEVKRKDIIFLIIAGIATGCSWLCYYYAIKVGQVSIVVPIDKLSIVVTVIFSLIVFKEKLSVRSVAGLTLLTLGTILMAVLTK